MKYFKGIITADWHLSQTRPRARCDLDWIKTQNDIVKYINNNLIDYLISINNNIKLNNNRKISKILFKTRLNEIGYKNIIIYTVRYKNS